MPSSILSLTSEQGVGGVVTLTPHLKACPTLGMPLWDISKNGVAGGPQASELGEGGVLWHGGCEASPPCTCVIAPSPVQTRLTQGEADTKNGGLGINW